MTADKADLIARIRASAQELYELAGVHAAKAQEYRDLASAEGAQADRAMKASDALVNGADLLEAAP